VYRWELNDPQVQAVFDGLPRDAADALVAFMDAVVFDPWEFARRPGESVDRSKNLRMLAFGSSGIVSFLILDDDREVLVLQIQWAG
jgi:hypothetical protein